MSPLNQPARDVLRLPGATSTPWAVFDADWYRRTYPHATAHLIGASAEAVLAFYFEAGQRLGHSPNMLFDEAWHRLSYPGIAALVDAGQFPSAFDAWCRGGSRERSPHWLFDEPEYRRRYPDLTDAFLSRNGLVNGYDHYLWRGNAEGRIGHPLFDPEVYRANLDPAAAEAAAADGPFWHCLRRLHRCEPEVRASPYFDPEWYRRRYPPVAEAIASGAWRWALEHYLANPTPTKFDPLPGFSEAWYLAHYEDAAEMVRRGQIRDGYTHFLQHGVAERRAASERLDLAAYAAREDVKQALNQGLAADPFVHWLANHAPSADLPEPPAAVVRGTEAPAAEVDSRTLFRRRARTLSVLHARATLNFDSGGAPAVSVIMVTRDRFELTMMTLGSLRANFAGAIDLVLIDAGSNDETRDITRYVRGATHFRFDTDIGVLAGYNAALQFATADTVLYLGCGAELAPGAIAAALRRLEENPRVGAVGGMLIGSDGLLSEAGGIVWRDGTTEAYAHGLSSSSPEANFARDVDFCASVFLMARRALLNELEGFDEHLGPGALADADLCLRMRETGFPVVYDPAVVVYSLNDGGLTEPPSDAETFARNHTDYLRRRPVRDEAMRVFARTADSGRLRVLFVEDTVPLRMIGSGFVRSNDIVREMATQGYAVTVYPLNGSDFDVASVYADMHDAVEVMHDHTLDQFVGFLRRRRGYYDVIWAARTHNLTTVRAAVEQSVESSSDPASGPLPPVILDTEAIAAVRDAGQAALEGRPFDLDAAVRSELRDATFCRTIVAINEVEAAILRDLEFPNVAIIGHMREPCPTPRPFAQRAGMLFVGAIHRMDSPNYDSLCWFIDEVLPLIARELTWETRLTVVGYTGPGVNLDRFRDHPRVTLRGAVSDTKPLYDSHRVFVAPTRIAAGTPYKVHEAASFGLPVVATDLLCRQLGWISGQDLLTSDMSDPTAFARHVVALQRDEALWQSLRDSALDRVRRDNNREAYAAVIRAVLGPPAADD